jgi:tRNA pseudouridine38-40 synthase
LSKVLRNLKLVIAYDGTDFLGWQRQRRGATIQGTLERVLEKITDASVEVHGSGRTDAGVHAAGQVANFKTSCPIPTVGLLKALNNLLPQTVRIRAVTEMPASFHARYDARAKTYRYRILQALVALPFINRFAYHYPFPLDRRNMAAAAKVFEGEHDFTSFAGSEGHAVPREEHGDNVRRIFSSKILWRPNLELIVYEVRGSGFLHHMVRNLVGTLIEVGRGTFEPRDMLRILEARSRTKAGPTAPALGLCLVRVEY